jgi:hypothetical protein
MKVVCIDNDSRHNYLSLNKQYLALDVDNSNYKKKNFRIKGDDGHIRWELKWRFVSLEEYRQNILNNLGI